MTIHQVDNGFNFSAGHYRPYFDCIQSNDVLGGRGVNIAQHPGNKRFRALVAIFTDKKYCKDCTPQEKKALARKIVSLCGGRYLTKNGQVWSVASKKDFVKKACQALRDCNRGDRSGYARGVKVPDEVKKIEKEIFKKNMSVKDLAKIYMSKSETDSCEIGLSYTHTIGHPLQLHSSGQSSSTFIQYPIPQPSYAPMPLGYSNPPPHQSMFYGEIQEACQNNHANTALMDDHLEGGDGQVEIDVNMFDTQSTPPSNSISNLPNSEIDPLSFFNDGLAC